MHLKDNFAIQFVISQFALLRIVLGGALRELGFGNLHLNL